MDHEHFGDTKENYQVMEAANHFGNTSAFQTKDINAIETLRDKKEKSPDIDTIHDYIVKTETSNANKALIKNLVQELIKQNTSINKKTAQGLDSFKILKKQHLIKLYLIQHK